jgi:hypothetical protein
MSLETSILAIQPSEIREAMRRYDNLIGPFGAFSVRVDLQVIFISIDDIIMSLSSSIVMQ